MIAGILAAALCTATPLPDSLPRLSALELDVTVDYERGRIDGSATLELAEGDGGCVPFQVGRLMTVASVTQDGVGPVPFEQDVVTYEDWDTYQVTQVWVSAKERSGPLRLTVSYGGPLVPYTESGMLYVRDHVDEAFTMLRSEARAFPVVAVPSNRHNRRSPGGDFRFRLVVTVPEGQVVAAPVPPSEAVEADGSVRWVFEGARPIPFLNVAVAPFEVVERPGLRVFHLPGDADGAGVVAGLIEETRGRYEAWFGPPIEPSPVTVIEIPEGWGSQASATAGIIQTADVFRSASAAGQLYHELAHLWHPADTGLPPDRWNEGLATFLQARVADVRGEASLDSLMTQRLVRVQRRLGEEAGLRDAHLGELGERGLTDDAYSAGALFFYVAYRVLGERRFDELLAGWFMAHREGSDTGAFVTFAERREPDLTPVLDDWFRSTGWVERVEAAGSAVGLARSPLRRLPQG